MSMLRHMRLLTKVNLHNYEILISFVFSALEDLYSDAVSQQYPQFVRHFERSYRDRKEMWAHCVRIMEGLKTHGNNTNNYCERSFGLTKDTTLDRCKVTFA